MCGITGFLSQAGEPASSTVLRNMTDAVAHRGPDGEGAFVDGPLALGHRRLAIIDLSPSGHQPMATRDGRFVLSYNGEIYNFRELRTELESLGYTFRSKTDSEVVLNAYAAWGEKSIQRLNGMFALAVWDKVKQTLFLARDRYGIKPLYYTVQNNTFIFGSEVKAILAHPAYKTALDKEALLEYFTFQNFFTDKTLFKDVHIFPAGSFATVSFGQPLKITRYWDFDFKEPTVIKDKREYQEELNRLFQQAVNRQLVSDVEVGAYLSGGMDSGSITAVAGRQIPGMKTFTVGFDLSSASGLELSFDERVAAEAMSYFFQTEHYEMVLKAGDMERILPKLVHHLEEPRVGQSYPNFYAAQLASKFCKVVLSGAGGDELFGGYPWRYYRCVKNGNFEHYIDKYYLYWQRLIDNKDIWRAFTPIKKEVEHVWTRNIFRDVFKEDSETLTRPEDYINHSLYFEAKTFLHGLLVVEDKLSMAYGLETRVPFLDNDLVDFAMKIPVSLKLGNLAEVVRIDENEPLKTHKYFEKTHDGKLILREMQQKYVPYEMTQKVKQGFSAPDSSWFKGESLEFVKRTFLENPNAVIYNFLDRSAILDMVGEHLSGKRNRRLLVWSLLNVEEWCRKFLLSESVI